ncbi:MAG TPA: hypothetical protein VKB75_16905 [Jatrophihabitans sp.]|nr:hypothetical protein [Jatrophihabitans sp.]
MHLVDVVLFAHILIAICAFAIATVLHVGQLVARGATSTATLKAWNPVNHRVEPLFPILALVLFALGAWLIGLSDGEFAWSDGWVITAAVGLGAMEAVGGAVLAPRGKKAYEAVAAAADGPVDPTLRAIVVDRAAFGAAFFETTTALGILFLMATKPSAAASVAIVVVCAVAGAVLGSALARPGVTVSAGFPSAAAAAEGE